jgi:hypothetical protein
MGFFACLRLSAKKLTKKATFWDKLHVGINIIGFSVEDDFFSSSVSYPYVWNIYEERSFVWTDTHFVLILTDIVILMTTCSESFVIFSNWISLVFKLSVGSFIPVYCLFSIARTVKDSNKSIVPI